MTSILLGWVNPVKYETKHVYIALISAYVSFVFYMVIRSNIMNTPDTNDVKIWILAGAMAVLMSIVAYFLKRLLETFEKKTEQLQEKLSSHHEQIVRILEKQDYHKDRITKLESWKDSQTHK